jgi:PAS domain-containing protein
MDAIAWLPKPAAFIPRGPLGSSGPDTPWLASVHLFSDVCIFVAMLLLPMAMVYFASRKPSIPFRRVLVLFAAFIFLCGTTHLLQAANFSWPLDRFTGLLRLVTAVTALSTVFALIRTAPEILSFPSSADPERETESSGTGEQSPNDPLNELPEALPNPSGAALQTSAALERRWEEEVEERTQELRRTVETLRKERKLLLVTLESTGDAIIVTNNKAKITYMNTTAQQLTGWTQVDAVLPPLATVFNVVDEETRDPVTIPTFRALAEGVIVGPLN